MRAFHLLLCVSLVVVASVSGAEDAAGAAGAAPAAGGDSKPAGTTNPDTAAPKAGDRLVEEMRRSSTYAGADWAWMQG